MVRACIKDNIMQEVKDILLNAENKTLLPKDKEKIEKGNAREKVFGVHIKYEIDNAGSDTEKFDELCERIIQWNLEEKIKQLLEEKNNDIVIAAKKRATLYQIENSDVYAINCLEQNEKDNGGNNWIPSLVKFAKSLSREPVDINLVLHDKDLGTKYDKPNPPTVFTEQNIVKEFESLKDLLCDGTKCRIAFFQHTTNSFVDILNDSKNPKRIIHEEVKAAFDRYSMGYESLIKMSEANLKNEGKDEFKKLCDEYNKQVSAQGREEHSILAEFHTRSLLEAMNEEAKTIIKVIA